MSHHRSLKQSGLATAVLLLLLAGFESLSYGLGTLPQTPCPCAADGVCRPSRDTWGYSQTRWRPWPGDPLSLQPTPAGGGTAGGGDEKPLDDRELPLPRQEDLRGPAKDKAKDKAETSEPGEAAANPDDEPAILLPGPGELPAFDPQGNNQEKNLIELPPTEDAPPALPASLRQAALSSNMLRLTTHHQQPATRPLVAQTIQAQPIRPVSWQQPSLGLINPASAIVADPAANPLQQAIYYEASDQNDGIRRAAK